MDHFKTFLRRTADGRRVVALMLVGFLCCAAAASPAAAASREKAKPRKSARYTDPFEYLLKLAKGVFLLDPELYQKQAWEPKLDSKYGTVLQRRRVILRLGWWGDRVLLDRVYRAGARHSAETYHAQFTTGETAKAALDEGVGPLLFANAMIGNELLVQVNPGVSRWQLGRALPWGMCVKKRINAEGLYLVGVPFPKDGKIERHVATVNALKVVQFAEPNFLLGTGGAGTQSPNDLHYPKQWHLPQIHATEAWGIITGLPPADNGLKAIVGVLDTGTALDHPDLKPNLLSGANFLGPGAPRDDTGHGTHVAGLIGAVGNNGEGVTGVPWRVKVLAHRVARQRIDSSGNAGIFTPEDRVLAAMYALRQLDATADHINIAVVNHSWFMTAASGHMKQEFLKAKCLHVVAAGNGNVDLDANPQYPACLDLTNDRIICVGASDPDDVRWSKSNFGRNNVDLFAPGVGIWSTFWKPAGVPLPNFEPIAGGSSTEGYFPQDGTCMAAAQVSGALALIKMRCPRLTPAEMRRKLLLSVDQRGSLSDKCVTGGRLNVFRMVQACPQ